MPKGVEHPYAQPSIEVKQAIGMFDSDAKRLNLVAAAPRPIASSTNAEKPAKVSPVMKA